MSATELEVDAHEPVRNLSLEDHHARLMFMHEALVDYKKVLREERELVAAKLKAELAKLMKLLHELLKVKA